MTDRAAYLARLFITRLRTLEETLRDEQGLDEQKKTNRRRDMIAKILAVEVGATDEVTVQRVASALPTIFVDQPTSDRDLAEFASFLRAKVDLEMR